MTRKECLSNLIEILPGYIEGFHEALLKKKDEFQPELSYWDFNVKIAEIKDTGVNVAFGYDQMLMIDRFLPKMLEEAIKELME